MLKELAPALRAQVARLGGTIAVCAEDIASGERVHIGSRAMLPMASVTKVPLMITLFRQHERGRIDLTKRIRITEKEKSLGSGLLHIMDSGLALTLRDLIVFAEGVSDNTATDLLYRVVSPAAVTREMRRLGLRISVTRSIDDLLRVYLRAAAPQMARLPHRAARHYERMHAPPWNALSPSAELRISKRIFADGRDCAPAGEITRLLCMLARGELADAQHTADMLDILHAQQHKGRLPHLLPDHVKMACKPGTLPGKIINDAGIVERGGRAVALSVFTWYRRDAQPISVVADVMGRIARSIYDELPER